MNVTSAGASFKFGIQDENTKPDDQDKKYERGVQVFECKKKWSLCIADIEIGNIEYRLKAIEREIKVSEVFPLLSKRREGEQISTNQSNQLEVFRGTYTLLHCLMATNSYDIRYKISLLMSLGFNLNEKIELHINEKCTQPSTITIDESRLQARPEAAKLDGATALHLAAWCNNLCAIHHLSELSSRLNWKIKDKDGWTVLHVVTYQNFSVEGSCVLKLILSFLRLDIGIDIQTKQGNTALHFAVLNKDHIAIELLLKYKARTDIKNKEGNTALHFAVLNKDHIAIELLLKYKARTDIKNKEGNTAFQCAIIQNDLLSGELLQEQDIKSDIQKKDGNTALTFLKRNLMLLTKCGDRVLKLIINSKK